MGLTGKLEALRRNVESVMFGKGEPVRQVLAALLARGHVLLEDVPGVGKTVLARAIARSVDCTFSRIQLTPDLLPSDVLGVSIYDQTRGEFAFKRGPIFAQLVLADEINRTTPRTQSALLEAMNESQVSNDGQTYHLGPPFMVLATQNPYDFEGTYFLPENQLDRFMIRVRIGYPDRQAERDILRLQPARTRLAKLPAVMSVDELLALQDRVAAVRMDDAITEYILSLAEATRKRGELVIGLSPRGTLALAEVSRASALLAGRDYVVPDDVKCLAAPVCAHRLVMHGLAGDGAGTAEAIFQQILQSTPAPK